MSTREARIQECATWLPGVSSWPLALASYPVLRNSAWEPALHTGGDSWVGSHPVGTRRDGHSCSEASTEFAHEVVSGDPWRGDSACVRWKPIGLAVRGHSGQMEDCGIYPHPRGTLGNFTLGVL